MTKTGVEDSGRGSVWGDAPPKLTGHLAALDGVRGLAVLLVMLFHQSKFTRDPTGGEWGFFLDRVYLRFAASGWAGVDLFFVLSGFLITGILLDARGSANYFRNFYMRRTLRIFPLYYAVLLVFMVIVPNLPHLLPAGIWEQMPAMVGAQVTDYQEVSRHQGWFWLYVSNVFFAFHGFTGNGIPDILWSLAIEEQFYLVWPAVVLWLGPRRLLWACSMLVVFALVFRVLLVTNGARWEMVYALTPSRLDVLAVGAFIAAWIRGPMGLAPLAQVAKFTAPLSLAALVLMGIGVGTLSEESPLVETLGFTLLAFFFGALLVLMLAQPSAWMLPRFFRSRPMRVLGKYSYAMYLFHVPIQSVLRGVTVGGVSLRPEDHVVAGTVLPAQFAFSLLATVLTLIAAVLSWNLFEKHFLRLKKFFPSGREIRAKQEAEERP